MALPLGAVSSGPNGRYAKSKSLLFNVPEARYGRAMSSIEAKTDRVYTKDHEWAKDSGAEVVIGISAFAVDQLGDITLVSLDVKVGDEVTAGKIFGTIESVKTLSDLYAPLSGTVTRINEDLENQPELINSDCWEKGWMLAITPTRRGEEESGLLSPAAYAAHIEASEH